jgi:type VI protein secretion system component Hcp
MSDQEQKKETTISPKPDDLTKTTKSGDIELEEEELKRVSGGAVTFSDMQITKLVDKSTP